MKEKFIKLLIVALFCFFFIGITDVMAAEWLVCDLPDSSQDVVGYDVDVDGAVSHVTLADVNGAARLLDVTGIAAATIIVRAVNSQGRQSDPVPFQLLSKPSAPSGLRMAVE